MILLRGLQHQDLIQNKNSIRLARNRDTPGRICGTESGRARSNKKYIFFLWLLLQWKVPSSDRIIKQGRQSDPICKLCFARPESHLHLLKIVQGKQTYWFQGITTNIKHRWNKLLDTSQRDRIITYTGIFGKNDMTGFFDTRQNHRNRLCMRLCRMSLWCPKRRWQMK